MSETKAPPPNPNACWGKIGLELKPLQKAQGAKLAAAPERCRKTGVYEPTVRVWTSKWASGRKSANFQMVGMKYCAECAATVPAIELMDAKMRGQVEQTFKADGKPLPDWDTVKVEWKELRPKADAAGLDLPAVEGVTQ